MTKTVRRNETSGRALSAVLAASIAAAIVGTGAGQPVQAAEKEPLGKFFLSGHSLTDNPYGNYIAAIAKSKGHPAAWDQQIVIGSPIRWRTRGDAQPGTGRWPGYAYGKTREGRDANVLAEFARAKQSSPYDTLIVAEAHHAIAQLRWNETPRFLRHFHDRFTAQNPAGRSFFFVPWEAVKDKSNPAPWLALEDAALPVWSCVAARINLSLEHEGRPDRMRVLPANIAIAALVRALTNGSLQLAGRNSPRRAVDAIIFDDVHLTPLGFYYLAAFSYAVLTGDNPAGGWAPTDIPRPEAAKLQEFAWKAYQSWRSRETSPSMAECRASVTASFCERWNGYVPDGEDGRQGDCTTFFAQDTADYRTGDIANPFVFNAAADKDYWLPAPGEN